MFAELQERRQQILQAIDNIKAKYEVEAAN